MGSSERVTRHSENACPTVGVGLPSPPDQSRETRFTSPQPALGSRYRDADFTGSTEIRSFETRSQQPGAFLVRIP